MIVWVFSIAFQGCNQETPIDCGLTPHLKECMATEDLHDKDLAMYVQEREMKPCFSTIENGKPVAVYCTAQKDQLYLCVEAGNTSVTSQRKCISTDDWLSGQRNGQEPFVVLDSTEYASLRYIGQQTIHR